MSDWAISIHSVSLKLSLLLFIASYLLYWLPPFKLTFIRSHCGRLHSEPYSLVGGYGCFGGTRCLTFRVGLYSMRIRLAYVARLKGKWPFQPWKRETKWSFVRANRNQRCYRTLLHLTNI